MNESKNAALNTVSSKDQLVEHKNVKIVRRGGTLKVLFVGNSITWHGPKADIGWSGDWGMAASCEEKDYVHRTVAMLDEKYGKVDYCVAQLAVWERDYTHTAEIMEAEYASARDFAADIVIIRIGENINGENHKRESCKPYFVEMIKYLTAKSDARVVVTDSFWKRPALDIPFYEAAAENGYIFCSIGDIENDKRSMALGEYEHRGVSIHPSDYGMELIARRIVGCL